MMQTLIAKHLSDEKTFLQPPDTCNGMPLTVIKGSAHKPSGTLVEMKTYIAYCIDEAFKRVDFEVNVCSGTPHQ